MFPLQRRQFLIGAAALGAGAVLGAGSAAAQNKPFELPKLPFDTGALEPYIDKQTVEIHYGKHHAAYVKNLNDALAANPGEWQSWSLEQLLRDVKKLPKKLQTAVRNNGGGHHNHMLYWATMSPNKDQKPSDAFAKKLAGAFGSVDAFRTKMIESGMGRFGSGWAWLVRDEGGGLAIVSTPNQDSPLMQGRVPLLGVDVWEHAYYLKYQNRRKDYLEAWWHLVDWPSVERT